MISLIVPYRKTHSHNATFAKCNAFFNDTTASNKTTRTNDRSPIENGSSRDVAVVFHNRIVFDQCARVDNAVAPDLGACIHNGFVHYNCTWADGRVARDKCGRGNDDW